MDLLLVKITHISGLQKIVLNEIAKYTELVFHHKNSDEIYLHVPMSLEILRNFHSINNAYVVRQGKLLHPRYINNHKSVLGELIELVIYGHEKKFKTFSLSCAGSDSEEIQNITKYISEHYKLIYSDDADLKIYIGKQDTDIWELGVCLTPRPLSVRDYRSVNIPGGMNPTIAYAMNTFCDLENISSYLNIFSGGATLLIEAGLINKNLKLIGFDIDGKRNSDAIKNIKEAGLIKTVTLKTADIYDDPDLGIFDVITSDLPFGMLIGKNDDMENLYRTFLRYCESHLDQNGTLVIYTSEYELMEKILHSSLFEITNSLPLKLITSVDSWLYPKILVCKFKK